MMPPVSSPTHNHLLAALSAVEMERLTGHLELVSLPLGEMLYGPGEPLRHAYFPTTAIVSLHHLMASGASAEFAAVGNEGVVGTAIFMGTNTDLNWAVVQMAGHAYRIQSHVLVEEFQRAGGMMRLLLRYTDALMMQIGMTAACNRHHTVEQQLCRWLLLASDRLSSGELVITQELIASMIGVRREGIVGAAKKLQQADIIRYRRGHVTVLERAGLERRVCECYSVIKKELGRLLSDMACLEVKSKVSFADSPAPGTSLGTHAGQAASGNATHAFRASPGLSGTES